MELTSEQVFLRNRDIIDQQKLDAITVIGAGGIGSALIRVLSIMGFDVAHIYDQDRLAEHNLSTTSFDKQYLNEQKSVAAAEVFEKYNGDTAHAYDHWRSGDTITPKVILGPDNMEVRRDVYEDWVLMPDREFLVDMRMGPTSMEIITVTQEQDTFMDTWQSSAEISDAPCTAKHTIFTANIVSGLGVNQIFNLLDNRPYYRYIWVGLSPLMVETQGLIVTGKEREADGRNRDHSSEQQRRSKVGGISMP